MNSKELFACMNGNKMPPRIPFVPTIYEHSARIINKTPSLVAKDEKLIKEGQLTAYKLYKHDLISVGVDIYNVEVEALGAMESEDELRKQVKKVIDTCGDYNKFIFGCGVVSNNTPPERVLLLKRIVEELNPRKII